MVNVCEIIFIAFFGTENRKVVTKLLHHLLQNKFTLGWYNVQLVEVLSTFCSKLQQPDLLHDKV